VKRPRGSSARGREPRQHFNPDPSSSWARDLAGERLFAPLREEVKRRAFNRPSSTAASSRARCRATAAWSARPPRSSSRRGGRWKQVGVIGRDLDTITGATASPRAGVGGISYSLAALDASAARGLEVVPLVKVGADLARARDVPARAVVHRAGRPIVETPCVNPPRALRYEDLERALRGFHRRRAAWTWAELGHGNGSRRHLRQLHLRFETDLATMQGLRRGFRGRSSAIFTRSRSHPGGRHARTCARSTRRRVADVLRRGPAQRGQNGAAGQRAAASPRAALERGVGAVCVTLGPRGHRVRRGRRLRRVSARRTARPKHEGAPGCAHGAHSAEGGGPASQGADVLAARSRTAARGRLARSAIRAPPHGAAQRHVPRATGLQHHCGSAVNCRQSTVDSMSAVTEVPQRFRRRAFGVRSQARSYDRAAARRR